MKVQPPPVGVDLDRGIEHLAVVLRGHALHVHAIASGKCRLLLVVQRRAQHLLGNVDVPDRNGHRFVGDAVDTDERGEQLARRRIDDLRRTSEIARLFQVLLILRRELDVQVLVVVRRTAYRVRHERHRAVVILPKRQPCLHRDADTPDFGIAVDKARLAVVAHAFQISRLLQRREVDAPAFGDLRAVEAAVVDRLVALPVGSLLFRFGRLAFGIVLPMPADTVGRFLRDASSRLLLRFLPHLLGLLFILGRIDTVRRENLAVLVRLLQHLFHDRKHVLDAFCRYSVEGEPLGVHTLPEEIGEEVVQYVAMTVEAQKILCVFRSGGFHVRRAVVFQTRDDADFTRLFVPDDQNSSNKVCCRDVIPRKALRTFSAVTYAS